MSTILTLLTDFGTRDPYLAEMKASCLAVWNRAAVCGRALVMLDLGHEVPRGDVVAAAWFLARVHPHFPPGTVQLAVVDPGVGTERPLVAASAHGQRFVAPGNGTLGFLGEAADLQVVILDDPRVWRPETGGVPAPTFHGRDVMGPVAARLAAGAVLELMGSPGVAADLGTAPGFPLAGTATDGRLGSVIWIDHFGNAISDIARESPVGHRLNAGATVRLGSVDLVGPCTTFGVAPPGRPFWYWGSGGCLEAALPQGDAAGSYGWECGLAIRESAP
jgi:S-adenosylmethionine hydrolase